MQKMNNNLKTKMICQLKKIIKNGGKVKEIDRNYFNFNFLEEFIL